MTHVHRGAAAAWSWRAPAAAEAGGSPGHDEHGYRAELVTLLNASRRIAEVQRPAGGITRGA